MWVSARNKASSPGVSEVLIHLYWTRWNRRLFEWPYRAMGPEQFFLYFVKKHFGGAGNIIYIQKSAYAYVKLNEFHRLNSPMLPAPRPRNGALPTPQTFTAQILSGGGSLKLRNYLTLTTFCAGMDVKSLDWLCDIYCREGTLTHLLILVIFTFIFFYLKIRALSFDSSGSKFKCIVNADPWNEDPFFCEMWTHVRFVNCH